MDSTTIDFPVAFRMSGWPVLVVGGGEVAERRVRALIGAGAKVTVVAMDISDGLEALRPHFELRGRPFEVGDVEGKRLVFAATDDPQVNRDVVAAARARGALANAADDPESCDFTMPAVARSGNVCIALTTGGQSPALAARLRTLAARKVLTLTRFQP